ncbi:mannosyltransferase [Mactra antiquata]
MSASSRTKKRNAVGKKASKELTALNEQKEKEALDPPVLQVTKDVPKPGTSKLKQEIEEDGPWTPGAYTAFKIIMSARLCAAAWNLVGDCDETYNYWEPTHYLLIGKGFQTWEYSPVYAIRSYAYIMLHTLPMRFYMLLAAPNPIMLFFVLRCVLAFVCTLCEVYFYKGVWKQFGSNTARILLCFQIMSAGMFISSSAYLPSSFCMYMTFLSYGGWYLQKYEVAIMATAASAILGWPFAGIIGAPIAIDILVRKQKFKLFILWCFLALITFLAPSVQIDQHYYGKLVIAPLNIVMYNVFTEHGPDLYGVEPFSFYFINGVLNFNIAFVLALVSLPFVILSIKLLKEKQRGIPCWLSISAMYIWFIIFFTRPHKEERFLYPVYPLICVCAAITVDYIQKWWEKIFPSKNVWHYSENTSWISVFIGIFFTLMSVSRIIAVYQAYHAPLDLYVELHKISSDPKVHTLPEDRAVNVCVGKEWYRYPSSFFLPGQNWNLQFLQSEFKGQLPKPYSTEPDATRLIPTEMNDMNKEEPSRYVNISKCHYLVDLDLPTETDLEPRYSSKTEEWKILVSIPFLDASRSHRVFRAFYIPFVSNRYCVYENYNLMKTTRTKKVLKQRAPAR